MVGRSESFDPLRADPRTLLPLAAEDLAAYSAAVFPGLELARHTVALIGLFEDAERRVTAGPSLLSRVSPSRPKPPREIVVLPPQHGKSTAAMLAACWFLGRNPGLSVIWCSYGAELSEDAGRRVRDILSSDLHRAIFPTCCAAGDSAAQHRVNLTAGGSFYAVGRGGAITGRAATGLLILDDMLKDRDEAFSETIRRGLHEWFRHVAYTRLSPSAGCICIGTRWHEADLLGWLLSEHSGEGWRLLHLPAIAEANDALGRAEGQPLWPERFSAEELESRRRQMGSSAFVALYQGRPSAASRTVFRREWFRTYREAPASFSKVVQSWDTAFKTGAENDFSACTTWGVTDSGYYLLSVWRGRVEFPELKRQFANQAEQWHPHVILVEDKASGQSLIQELKQATTLPVLPVKVDSDKRARAEAVTPLFEAGKVFFPESAPWLNDYTDELATFPAGAHDDCVDSTTQALNYLREQPWPSGIFAWYRDEAEAIRSVDTDRAIQPQEEKDRAFNRLGRVGQVRDLGKVAVPDQAPGCPKCANKYPSGTGGGLQEVQRVRALVDGGHGPAGERSQGAQAVMSPLARRPDLDACQCSAFEFHNRPGLY